VQRIEIPGHNESGELMATAALVSVGEYLNTSYRPDQEMLEGQLVERNVGEYDHSNLQGALVAWMRQRQREWNIRVLPEQRIQISLSRFRVPDICVVSREQELESVFTRPPLICIEILSKDDTLRSMQERVDDYRAFGVPNIWVLDPVKRRAYVCTHGDFREPEGETLEIALSPVRIPLQDLFSDLD
jgi:Uma2 family endonuclease